MLAFGASAPLALGLSGTSFGTSKLGTESLEESISRLVRELAAGQDISLKVLLPNGSQANVTPIAEAFSAATGVKVEFELAPVDDINTRLLLDTLSQDSNVDVALPATFGLPDLVAAGALLNLDRFVEDCEPSNFQDSAKYTLGDHVNGHFYGYQTDGDVYLMFYNTQFLDDQNQQHRFEDRFQRKLEVPQTWAQLDQTMAFFHDPDEGQYGGALFRTPGYVVWEWWIRFHAKGKLPFDADMNPLINSEEGIEALEELISASKSLYPGAGSNGLFENWEAFGNGEIFCNIGWGGTQKYLNGVQSKIADTLAFGPTPGMDVDGEQTPFSYFNWGWNYSVPTFAKSPAIGYLFTLFASTVDNSTLGVQQGDGFFDPFRTEHYADQNIRDIYGDAFLIQHRRSMQNAIPDLYLTRKGEYFDTLRAAIMQAIEGSSTPKRALDTCANRWNRTTRLVGQDAQSKQWAFLRDKYPDGLKR